MVMYYIDGNNRQDLHKLRIGLLLLAIIHGRALHRVVSHLSSTINILFCFPGRC